MFMHQSLHLIEERGNLLHLIYKEDLNPLINNFPLRLRVELPR